MSHTEQRRFCERVKEKFPDDFTGGLVLDVGSLDINGSNRGLFTDCSYVGIDLTKGENVDVVCSAHEHKGQYDTIISTEAFEHDPNIGESLNNIVANLLKPGGLFVFTCARDGRPEHGTTKSKPYDSPATNDYYLNLSEKLIRELIDIELYFGDDFKFSANSDPNDLYFVGRKKMQGENRLETFWSMPKVSIIIPVIRPACAEKCVAAIKENADIPAGQYEIITEVDINGIGCPKMVEKLTARAKHDLVMFLGDDTEPEPGFLTAAIEEMDKLPGGWGVVGLNTQDPQGSNKYAHWLAHKKILEHIPGGAFFPTVYRHCFGDIELRDISDGLDRWVFAADSKITHNHPVNETAPYDETYSKAYDDGKWEADQDTYFGRKIERTKATQGVRLGIGWPVTDQTIYTNFAIGFMRMKLPHYDFFMPTYPGNIDAVRNDIVRQAQVVGCTHLWLTDTDQIYYDDDTLEKLMAHDKPIVTAPVHRRYPPFDPILTTKNSAGETRGFEFDRIKQAMDDNELLEIETTGAGCVLIQMETFLKIDLPYFKSSEYGEHGPGEDIYFFNKVRKAGIPVYTDCSINVDHLTLMGVGFQTHLLYHNIITRGENGERIKAGL
ncbi:MAG: methyltransferase domain-containing protein [FCB group bacterium]|nr:methyltransferase domain-containing protein [FCB group bacterium]